MMRMVIRVLRGFSALLSRLVEVTVLRGKGGCMVVEEGIFKSQGRKGRGVSAIAR